MNLAAVLDRVSQNCLRGQPAPDDLRRLWQAQIEGDAEPLNAADLVLIEVFAPDFFEGYRPQDGVPPDIARAYQRMFEQIAFIGQVGDGSLLGYWLGEERRPVASCPLVELDTEGQFYLWGTNLSEYLLLKADDCMSMSFGEVQAWLVAHGSAVGVYSPQDIRQRLGAFVDPNVQFDRYWDEEQMV